MRPLKVSRKVCAHYRNVVKGNKFTPLEQIEKKFVRNMALVILEVHPEGRGTYCLYGKLHFIVSDDDVVVWMRNNCPSPKGWKKDNEKYLQLNKELGIW